MSEEKKFKTEREIHGFTVDEMPEWALGHEGLENFLDGMRVQHSVNEKMKREGQDPKVPDLSQFNLDEYKGMSQEHTALEIIAGCLVAYFAAMAQAMPTDLFARAVGPLIDTLCTTLAKAGVYDALDEVRTDVMMEKVKKRYNDNLEQKAQSNEVAQKIAEFDKPTALAEAVEKLKALGKGMLN